MKYTLGSYDKIAEYERVMLESYLLLESIHPIDIIEGGFALLEEAEGIKHSIDVIISNVEKALRISVQKFREISGKINKENSVWLQQAQNLNINKIEDWSDFSDEIFPYWNGLSVYKSLTIPRFISDSSYDNENEFMQKHFAAVLTDGAVDKNKLRGLSDGATDKLQVEGDKAKSIYKKAVDTIPEIMKLRRKVGTDMDNIRKTVKQVGSMKPEAVTESTLLGASIFKNEYFDILLESEGEQQINVDPADNEKSNKNDTMFKSVVKWSKLCTAVVSAEMDILDESYGACVAFVDAIMKKAGVNVDTDSDEESEETNDNQDNSNSDDMGDVDIPDANGKSRSDQQSNSGNGNNEPSIDDIDIPM